MAKGESRADTQPSLRVAEGEPFSLACHSGSRYRGRPPSPTSRLGSFAAVVTSSGARRCCKRTPTHDGRPCMRAVWGVDQPSIQNGACPLTLERGVGSCRMGSGDFSIQGTPDGRVITLGACLPASLSGDKARRLLLTAPGSWIHGLGSQPSGSDRRQPAVALRDRSTLKILCNRDPLRPCTPRPATPRA